MSVEVSNELFVLMSDVNDAADLARIDTTTYDPRFEAVYGVLRGLELATKMMNVNLHLIDADTTTIEENDGTSGNAKP